MNWTGNESADTNISNWFINVTGTIGLLAALDNAFILFVFFSKRKLLESSPLLVILTMAHALNGILHACSYFTPSRIVFVPVSYCIKVIFPSLFISIYQILPIILALNGLERLLAMAAPVWYRANVTNSRVWLLIGVTCLLGLVPMMVTALHAYYDQTLVPSLCAPPDLFAIEYLIYAVHTPAVIGGVLATVCTSVGVWIGRRRIAKMPSNSQNEIRRMKKQMRLTKCLLLISVIDLICVVMPNVIFILYLFQLIQFPTRYLTPLFIIYCFDSVWNIVAFLLFNSEFRKICKKMFKCGLTKVTPIGRNM